MKGYLDKIRENKQGLLIWGVLILNMMLVFVQRLYISLMPDYLMEKFSIDITSLANFTSATFYGYALFQIPSGLLIDRIGIRKLNILGTIVTSLGAGIFCLTDSYFFAVFGRLLIGAGSSVVITSILKVQVLWFKPRYFSQLSAAMAFLSSLGSLAGTLPLALLIKYTGVQNTLYIITGVNILFIFVMIAFIRDKVGEKNLKNTLNNQEKSVFTSMKEVLSNKGTYPPLFMGLFFISTTTSLTGLWVITYLMKTYQMEKIQAAGYMLYFTLGFMAGAPLVSFVDRILKGNYKLATNIFTGIYVLLWGYFIFICKGVPEVNQLPLLFFLMGVVIMFHLLPFTAIKEANAIENSGIATSMTNTMEFIGSGILNIFIAALIKGGYTVGSSFIVIFISALLAFISSLFIQYNKENIN